MSANRQQRLCCLARKAREAFRAKHATRGFSLVEAVVTLAMVSLVAAAMSTGIALAVRQYDASLTVSEAKVLQSTLKTTLQNELSITSLVVLDGNESDADREVKAIFSPNYAVAEGYSEFKIANEKTDSSGRPYGEIALGTGTDPVKWKKLVSSSSYHQNLGVQLEVIYHKANTANHLPAYFTVYMSVLSAPDKVVLTDEFDVVPLNEVSCKNAADEGII